MANNMKIQIMGDALSTEFPKQHDLFLQKRPQINMVKMWSE